MARHPDVALIPNMALVGLRVVVTPRHPNWNRDWWVMVPVFEWDINFNGHTGATIVGDLQLAHALPPQDRSRPFDFNVDALFPIFASSPNSDTSRPRRGSVLVGASIDSISSVNNFGEAMRVELKLAGGKGQYTDDLSTLVGNDSFFELGSNVSLRYHDTDMIRGPVFYRSDISASPTSVVRAEPFVVPAPPKPIIVLPTERGPRDIDL